MKIYPVKISVSWVLKKNEVPWLTFANIIGPLIFLGYAIGRLGCFLVGDDYGIPSNLPWAMSFPKGIPPTTTNVFSDLYPWIDISGYESGLITVHPTQLYEAIFEGLILFLILIYLRNKGLMKITGLMSGIFLICYSIFRFIIEFLRVPDEQVGYLLFNLTMGQIISCIFFLIGIYLTIVRYENKKES